MEKQKTRRDVLIGIIKLIGAVIVGEVGIWAALALARASHWPTLFQWLAMTAVITVGGYLMFGWPQIAAAKKGQTKTVINDPRVRWALPLLGRGGVAMFVIATLIGGPLLIGWWFGRVVHPQAWALTSLAALLFAAFWSAFYLGLLSALTRLF